MQIIVGSPGPTSQRLLVYTLLTSVRFFLLPTAMYSGLGQFGACLDGAAGQDEATSGATTQNMGLPGTGPPPDHGRHNSFALLLSGGHPSTPQHLVNTSMSIIQSKDLPSQHTRTSYGSESSVNGGQSLLFSGKPGHGFHQSGYPY